MRDELLDIVDENDRVTGQMLRSEIYRKNLSCFRVVNAFIEDDKGRLWIPRRSADKKLFPMCLDMSMGGHVMAGEIYEEAFARELREELHMEATEQDFQMIGHLTPNDHGVSAFMKVYRIRTNQPPNYNTDDFVASYWLYPWEILFRIRAGDLAKDDLPKLVRIFYKPFQKNLLAHYLCWGQN